MPHRIVIISDTHFGHPRHAARSAQALRPLWQSASHLIINGDCAEIHHPEYKAAALQELASLRALCENDGVQLTLLPGNHDPLIVSTPRYLHLLEGRLLVMHGEALHPAIAPWSRHARDIAARFHHAMQSLPQHLRDRIDGILEASKHASIKNVDAEHVRGAETTMLSLLWRPWAIVRLLQYWRDFPKLAAAFLEQFAPHTRFIAVGHSHRAGVWSIEGRTIINTGAFGFPTRPLSCIVDDDRIIRVHAVQFKGDHYEHASAPLTMFDAAAESPSLAADLISE